MSLQKLLLISLVLLAVLLLSARLPLTYNLRNLVVRWRITALTALAFTLVVALLTVMLAFVNGMYRLTQASGIPGNVIILSDGATDELFSNLAYRDSSNVEYGKDSPVLRDEQGQPMVSREVYLVVNQPLPPVAGERKKRRFLQVRGIDDPVMSGRVHGLELHPGGKWFSGPGVEPALKDAAGRQAIQAVLGEGVAKELGADQGKESLAVGDRFYFGEREWVIVGITKSSGTTFGSEIWAKRAIVGPLFGKEFTRTTIVARTADLASAKAFAQDLTRNYKYTAVQALPEIEYYEKLQETNKQFLVAIIFVAVVLAVGGVFGVMNTMFAAISQRIRDIGVLRILGFSPRQILMSFFIESLLIALIGGLLGCAVGYLCNGWSATSIVSGSQGGGKSVVFQLVVDRDILAAGLLFTLAMGALGGFLPALSAMRLKPLDAVR